MAKNGKAKKPEDTKLPLPVEKSSKRAPVPRGGSVVPYDPLTAYLREMRRMPRLSKEEEHDLAVRFKEKKDIEAAYKLVKSNLWLVVKLSRDYEKSARNLLDLIQEGNIGLMEAVKNYDPYRGVRFPSYAVWWIKAYIIRFMIANIRMVKVGTTQAQRKLFFNLRKEKEKLEKMGVYPEPKLLADKLNVKESEVVEMEQRLGSPDLSVDAPLGGDESAPDLHGVLPSGDLSSEELVSRKEQAEFIQKGFDDFSETLKDKEKTIFLKRMVNEDKATLQELSDELGISRERVRQIESRMKEKLKVFFEEKLEERGEVLEFE